MRFAPRPAPLLVLGLLLVVAGTALLIFRPWRSVPATAKAALLADVGGPIVLAATSLNSARRSALRNAPLMNHIANALPPEVRLLALVNDREAFRVVRDPWPGRLRFVELPEQTSITMWPQDPFLVLRGADGKTELLTSKRFERADDAAMARALARDHAWSVRSSELLFEGGNVLADERWAFVGGDTIRNNAAQRGESESAVVVRFEEELGKAILVVGPVPQPVGHLDLVLTPLGEGRLLLADPGWGAEIVAKLSVDETQRFERELMRSFFGDPAIESLPLLDGESLRPPAIAGVTSLIVDQSRDMDAPFEELARNLRDRGFEVFRVPFLGPAREAEAAVAEPRPTPGPGYPVLSYNNVLVERRLGGKRVYLPRHGLSQLDAAAERAWREIGFEVHPVESLAVSAMYGGGLRCAVKVLVRGF